MESILRSLSKHETTEEKLRALCELHCETLEHLRETQATMDKWKKNFQASQKENNRSLLARDRLEGLCRYVRFHPLNATFSATSITYTYVHMLQRASKAQ